MLSKYNVRWLYTADFIQTLEYYAKCLTEKVMSSFDDISAEARKVAQETQNQFTGGDLADIAEHVRDAEVDFCLMAHGMIQGIRNMFTAGLYHLFEQQLLRLHRQELLFEIWSPYEEPPREWLCVKEAQKRLLRDYKIDITAFASWSTLEELRLVANTVKHAEGDSCTKLKRTRPDLFIDPVLEDLMLEDTSKRYRPVYQPLAGEDLYISLKEFIRYVAVTKQFWKELEQALDQLPD
jgi:hypothetical protein